MEHTYYQVDDEGYKMYFMDITIDQNRTVESVYPDDGIMENENTKEYDQRMEDLYTLEGWGCAMGIS